MAEKQTHEERFDAVLRRLANMKPMTVKELSAKLKAERTAKKAAKDKAERDAAKAKIAGRVQKMDK